MATLTIMIGISGSDRSTYAAELAAETGAVHLSSDAIREELLGDISSQSSPALIFNTMYERTVSELSAGHDVIYDATNLSPSSRAILISKVKREVLGAGFAAVYLKCTVEEALQRQALRDRKVPESVIRRQAARCKAPTADEGYTKPILIISSSGSTVVVPPSVNKEIPNKDESLIELLDRAGDNWRDIIIQAPYYVMVSMDGPYTLFMYNHYDSDMSYRAVRECRGHILKRVNGKWEYVCRPFDKFFNYGEMYAADIDWKTARVTEKIDGSLMKVWADNGKWHLSTNGVTDAFTNTYSDMPTTFGDVFERAIGMSIDEFGEYLDPEYTYMFELTSPSIPHPIHMPEAVWYLSRRNPVTGVEQFDRPELPGVNYPKIYELNSLDAVVKFCGSMGEDQEGCVINDAHSNRLKVKSPVYLQMHYLANLNEDMENISLKRLFALVKEGVTDDFSANFPVLQERIREMSERIKSLASEYEVVWKEVEERSAGMDDKTFAEMVKKEYSPYAPFLFARKNKGMAAEEYLFGTNTDKALKLLGYKN